MKAADLKRALVAALVEPRESGVVAEFTEADRRLAVVVRPDGDIQVELHLPDRPGSPFEAMFVVPEAEVADTSREVAGFVEQILGEQLVLAWDGRLFRGGRCFVPPAEAGQLPGIRWVASWKGTHDRQG